MVTPAGRPPPRTALQGRHEGRPSRDGTAAHPVVDALHRAADHCQAAFAYCTTEASEVQDLEDLLCLVDCAQMCRTTADFILRRGTYVKRMMDLCAQQVRDAAANCRGSSGDPVLASCADVLDDALDALRGGTPFTAR